MDQNKKVTVNPINKIGNRSLEYLATVTRGNQKITKIKPFIDKYNKEGMNYPSEKYDWKKFKKTNLTIALEILYAKIYTSCCSLKP